MTLPRSQLVALKDTPYYHIVTRCVRRTFLCGIDQHTGKNFEHRRQWIEDRIRLLSSIFAVDVCAYAVMSNHVHLVLKLNPAEVDTWTSSEVQQRWQCLFSGPNVLQKAERGQSLCAAEHALYEQLIGTYRQRLGSLSWFMKCLNEPIARRANQEDKCTGHFWESRFKSQALLTEEALLSCMAYVDLNPVRTCMAKTPEESAHTSIKERLSPSFDLKSIEPNHCRILPACTKPLVKFEGNELGTCQLGILFSLPDYLDLVDQTGRILRDDKRGAIAMHLPPILQRLNLDQKEWLTQCTRFEAIYQQRFRPRPSFSHCA